MRTAQAREIVSQLEHEAVAQQVREALGRRERWHMPSEFPIVGGADVGDLDELLQHMLTELKAVLGLQPITLVRTSALPRDAGWLLSLLLR
jgi:hypothetical protein